MFQKKLFDTYEVIGTSLYTWDKRIVNLPSRVELANHVHRMQRHFHLQQGHGLLNRYKFVYKFQIVYYIFISVYTSQTIYDISIFLYTFQIITWKHGCFNGNRSFVFEVEWNAKSLWPATGSDTIRSKLFKRTDGIRSNSTGLCDNNS